MFNAKGLRLIKGKRYMCYTDKNKTSTWVCTKVPENDFEMVGAQVEDWQTDNPGLCQYTDAHLKDPVLGWTLTINPYE